MPVKVTGLVRLNKKLKKGIPDAKSAFAKEAKRSIVDIIVESITSGISPVTGQNRYKKYSKDYSKKKGRSAPIDLVESGDMLNDMIAVQKANKDIEIKFRTAKQRKKAAGHDYGTDKLPQRKILPSRRGESFKKGIMDKIMKMMRDAMRKGFR